MHLACIGMAELADLQVDDQKAVKPAVEEQQIDTEPTVVQSQSPLPAHEGQVVAKFQEEVGQVLDQRVFEI